MDEKPEPVLNEEQWAAIRDLLDRSATDFGCLHKAQPERLHVAGYHRPRPDGFYDQRTGQWNWIHWAYPPGYVTRRRE
jgi:hypothetical protein